jgi:hypothetical protein
MTSKGAADPPADAVGARTRLVRAVGPARSRATGLSRGRLRGVLRDFSVTDDASPGEWIAPRLGGEFGAVTLAVPSGYEAYARICHPARDSEGRSVSWPEVAGATRRTAHPLMQWHALVGSSDPFGFRGSLWPGAPPECGILAPQPLEMLCGLLAMYTTDAEHCFLAVWAGWGWVYGGGLLARLEPVSTGSSLQAAVCEETAFSAEELSRPRLTLHNDRDYVLLVGPLKAALQLGDASALGGFSPKSPNLFWPADRMWFVASEIDFDSTLVGGPGDLIQAVLDAPGLDAWRVNPDDSLAADADHVNRVAG